MSSPNDKVNVKDKEMAKKDVKYKQVWKCRTCGVAIRFPQDVWDSWSNAQRLMYTDELERQHLVHPEG